MADATGFYERLNADRARAGAPDSADYDSCVRRTVEALLQSGPDDGPGLFATELQSGKVRAFVGIIALAFDKGFDIAVVLTAPSKGPKNPIVSRIAIEFQKFRAENLVQVYDFLIVPQTTLDLMARLKLVIVVPKNPDNTSLLLDLFSDLHQELLSKRVLIIDDEEAELAATPFAKKRNGKENGAAQEVGGHIEALRHRLRLPAFLQAMSSPSTLYLRPGWEEERAHAYPPEKFDLLATHEMRAARRYQRPFAVARLTLSNLDAVRGHVGPRAAEQTYSVALHAVIGALRDCDFVTARGASTVLIGFPQTGAAVIREIVVPRLRQAVRETTKVQMELGVEIAEDDDIAAILAER